MESLAGDIHLMKCSVFYFTLIAMLHVYLPYLLSLISHHRSGAVRDAEKVEEVEAGEGHWRGVPPQSYTTHKERKHRHRQSARPPWQQRQRPQWWLASPQQSWQRSVLLSCAGWEPQTSRLLQQRDGEEQACQDQTHLAVLLSATPRPGQPC